MPGNLRIRKVKLHCKNISTSRVGAKKDTSNFNTIKICCRTTKLNWESRKYLDWSKCQKFNLCCINPKKVSRITEFVFLCLTTFCAISIWTTCWAHPNNFRKAKIHFRIKKSILEGDSSALEEYQAVYYWNFFNKTDSTLIPSFYTGHKSICYDWL